MTKLIKKPIKLRLWFRRRHPAVDAIGNDFTTTPALVSARFEPESTGQSMQTYNTRSQYPITNDANLTSNVVIIEERPGHIDKVQGLVFLILVSLIATLISCPRRCADTALCVLLFVPYPGIINRWLILGVLILPFRTQAKLEVSMFLAFMSFYGRLDWEYAVRKVYKRMNHVWNSASGRG